MSKEIILLLLLNLCSAIGYSLIAPLFPSEAIKRNIKENICGIVISMFAVSNFFATPFCPTLISKYGRKNILYVACILEASSTLVYGLLQYVSGYYSFLLISIITRLFHGVGASFSATLVYSIAASICEPDKVKITLGQMELAWCVGIAIGPMCGSFFFYLGGYSLPFNVVGITILCCMPFIYSLQLPEEEEGEVPQFMEALFDFTVLSIFFTVVMDIFSRSFYFPTFSDHLIGKFGMSIESSSLCFVVNIVSYFILLNYINIITQKLGLKLTLVCGLFCLFLGVLFLPPIPILPQSIISVVIGQLLLGIPAAIINVPAICDLMETLKAKKKLKLDDNTANDMASAIYNLGLNFGEALGPTFGGYVTEKANFQTSCVYTSLINLSYCIFFGLVNYKIIQKQLEEGKKLESPSHEEIDKKPDLRKLLKSDYSYEDLRVKAPRIDPERVYVGRFRSYTHSRRSSVRSSLVHIENS